MHKHDPTAPSEKTHLPRLALTHGQTIWLLTDIGLSDGVSTSTFNYYIKSMRKLGIPFEKGKDQAEGHRHVTYNFEEIMELAIALLLRVYGTLPDALAVGLLQFRKELRPIYRQAYFDLFTPKFPVLRFGVPNGPKATAAGLYLDLNIRYAAGQMVQFGPPRAVSPFEAVSIYTRSRAPALSYLPLNVTAVAEMIVARTKKLPPIRRGRTARALKGR